LSARGQPPGTQQEAWEGTGAVEVALVKGKDLLSSTLSAGNYGLTIKQFTLTLVE
jgi:hypothetical protein